MEETIEEKAFRAYFRRFGENAPCPSRHMNWAELRGKDYLVLSNVNGVLAVYRVYHDGRIKWVNPRWFGQQYGSL